MKVKTACAYVIVMCIRGCQIDNAGQLDKVLFTLRYTDKQITALTFFLPLQKQWQIAKAELSDFKGWKVNSNVR